VIKLAMEVFKYPDVESVIGNFDEIYDYIQGFWNATTINCYLKGFLRGLREVPALWKLVTPEIKMKCKGKPVVQKKKLEKIEIDTDDEVFRFPPKKIVKIEEIEIESDTDDEVFRFPPKKRSKIEKIEDKKQITSPSTDTDEESEIEVGTFPTRKKSGMNTKPITPSSYELKIRDDLWKISFRREDKNIFVSHQKSSTFFDITEEEQFREYIIRVIETMMKQVGDTEKFSFKLTYQGSLQYESKMIENAAQGYRHVAGVCWTDMVLPFYKVRHV
jgi:hypothetical protein